MAVPAVEPLGPVTLNRMWYLDVNTGTALLPVWVRVRGISDFKPDKDPTLQDDSDFDGEGWKSQAVTALGWSLECKAHRKVDATDATAYDDGQEFLRIASDGMGVENDVHVRWYEMTPDGPRVEAYDGHGTVVWKPDGGDMAALNTVSVTINGRGKRNSITHPDTP